MKRLTIIFAILVLSTFVRGQEIENYSDELLTNSFKAFYQVDFELAWHILPFLKERFVNELLDTSSFDNPYDSLSRYVTINRSSDNLLKIYCWDERSDGCRWSSTSFAQFKTKSGEIKSVNLEEIAAECDEDLYITDLQKIEINNETHYLVIGSGGHCGNHIYTIARVYKILNDSLVKCDSIFGGKNEIEVGTNRTGEIKMQYSPETKILSFYSYAFDEQRGFYSNERFLVKWKLFKDGFKLIN